MLYINCNKIEYRQLVRNYCQWMVFSLLNGWNVISEPRLWLRRCDLCKLYKSCRKNAKRHHLIGIVQAIQSNSSERRLRGQDICFVRPHWMSFGIICKQAKCKCRGEQNISFQWIFNGQKRFGVNVQPLNRSTIHPCDGEFVKFQFECSTSSPMRLIIITVLNIRLPHTYSQWICSGTRISMEMEASSRAYA